jgi:hypothetical protein
VAIAIPTLQPMDLRLTLNFGSQLYSVCDCVCLSLCVCMGLWRGGGHAVCVWVMNGTFEFTKWHFTILYKVHGISQFKTKNKGNSLYIVLLKL